MTSTSKLFQGARGNAGIACGKSHIALVTITLITIVALCGSCVKAPQPIEPIPTPQQVEWQKMETYAFVHFGINTFNDMEWGYGNSPASTFNPKELDCDQWVRTLKACGMKAVILTAKHCDGFCLWPTKTTDYNIANSPYKNGKGDLVKELSEACRKNDMKFGLYLSPWDRNNAEYAREAYVETYQAQVKELIENYSPVFEFWFDGANGGNGWYGGADETRSIDANHYYNYERATNTILQRNPDAMIFGGTVPTIRWVGNEQGWAGDTQWSTASLSDFNDFEYLTRGSKDGDAWLPSEVDVSMRPGWFYHAREDHQLKSLAQLLDIYYRSVGHNANLLLNFPINLDGKIPTEDSIRITQWHQALQNDFSDNLLKTCTVTANNERGRRFKANKVTDGDWNTYWATGDGTNRGELVFEFPEKTNLNRIVIQEYIPLGQRVESFTIDRFINGKWLPVDAYDNLTTVGYKRIVRIKTVAMEKLRIRFKRAKGPLCISNVEAYCAETTPSMPEITRNFDNEVVMKSDDKNAKIYYTIDGNEPNLQSACYSIPFKLEGKAIVKAVSYETGNTKPSEIAVKEFDIPNTQFVITAPADALARRLFDGNDYSTYYLSVNKNTIEIHLKEKMKICGFRYTPDQSRDANQHISNYQLYVDGVLASEGEFSNIVNNPIEQTIRFDAVEGRNVKFVASKFVPGTTQASVAEFSVITE